mmetsp:Transcript_33022/g.105189  ORF Transcript_33022/g.105189 Transcript_33022/m.105189 type:complete len:364 (-) Transcript_33022:1348-2439(-)
MPPKRGADPVADAQVAKKAKQAAARAEFMKVYDVLRDEMCKNEIIAGQPDTAKTWFKRMLDYNVPGGKLNRGMAVLDSLKAIKGEKGVSKDEAFLADTMGWCIEWLQAFFLVADDIMDNSVTRRGQPCWYKVEDVGMVACNDCILLETCIYAILKKYFRSHPMYVEIFELFQETTFQTSSGQLLDLITAPIGTVDLTKYTMDTYMRIVTYKTAFYTIYMPFACGMILAGVTDPKAYESAKEISIRMGQFFQIQDDYLDNFADPEVLGKVGTDIKDNKCSWLVVQALLKATPAQKELLAENYGKDDDACEQRIKKLYGELELEALFKEYEEESYGELVKLIKGQDLVPEEVYMAMLSKIYKRQK